jgi:hypothetical protein
MKAIDKLITEYENIWNSGRFDLSIEKVTQDLHKLKAELKEQHKKDIIEAYHEGKRRYGVHTNNEWEQYYNENY